MRIAPYSSHVRLLQQLFGGDGNVVEETEAHRLQIEPRLVNYLMVEMIGDGKDGAEGDDGDYDVDNDYCDFVVDNNDQSS